MFTEDNERTHARGSWGPLLHDPQTLTLSPRKRGAAGGTGAARGSSRIPPTHPSNASLAQPTSHGVRGARGRSSAASLTARGVPTHDGGCQCHHSRLEAEGFDDVALGVGYNRRLLWPRHVLGHDTAETAERDEH